MAIAGVLGTAGFAEYLRWRLGRAEKREQEQAAIVEHRLDDRAAVTATLQSQLGDVWTRLSALQTELDGSRDRYRAMEDDWRARYNTLETTWRERYQLLLDEHTKFKQTNAALYAQLEKMAAQISVLEAENRELRQQAQAVTELMTDAGNGR